MQIADGQRQLYVLYLISEKSTSKKDSRAESLFDLYPYLVGNGAFLIADHDLSFIIIMSIANQWKTVPPIVKRCHTEWK